MLMFLSDTHVFTSLQLSEHLGISMELGCFMAGVVLSSNGEHLVHKVKLYICMTALFLHYFLFLFNSIILKGATSRYFCIFSKAVEFQK